MQPKVLILDGETRSALAVVRSLGKQGYAVGVASADNTAIAFKSKYTDFVFVCPKPANDPENYLKWLGLILEEWQPDVLLPVTDASMTICFRAPHLISRHTILPVAAKPIFEQVTDKGRLMQLAAEVGLDTPKTVMLSDAEHWTAAMDEAIKDLTYPAVLKARFSVYDLGVRLAQGPMYYVESPGEVREKLAEAYQRVGRIVPYILQERVAGVGIGVFSLCVSGESVAEFCHRRVLEKPPSGGRSVLSESIAPGEAPVAKSLELLKRLQWHGMAMVEFKSAPNGKFYLMEINPRFWGSLQLAIDCNRDFPAMLCELCRSGATEPAALRAELQQKYGEYLLDQRLRWLLGTLDHLIIRCRGDFFGTIRDVFVNNALQINTRGKRTRFEVCRADDIRPFLQELRNYLLQLLGYGS